MCGGLGKVVGFDLLMVPIGLVCTECGGCGIADGDVSALDASAIGLSEFVDPVDEGAEASEMGPVETQSDSWEINRVLVRDLA